VDALEHGFRLEADLARVMAAAGDGPGGDPGRAGVLGQLRGDHPAGRLCLGRGRAGLAERRAAAHESVRLAHAAGVLLGAGTDFGGGWLRANQLPWEGETLVAAGLEPYDALAAATVNGGRLLGEPGAGVLAEGGSGRLPARPRRPPVGAGVAVAGVAHQLVTPSALTAL
jgi:imidazolonepropionase-like amidohydrolase